MSHKDVPPKKTDFNMYDAILSGTDSVPPPVFDPEMEKFMPMLTDYLKSEGFMRRMRRSFCLQFMG